MKIIVNWFRESALMEKVFALPLFIMIPLIFFKFYEFDGWNGIVQLLSILSSVVILFGTLGLYLSLRIKQHKSEE